MGSSSQARAVNNYRKRLSKRGLMRFEVLGLKKDRELVRTVARRLAENNLESEELRATVGEKISPDTRKKGGIYEALRRSPLVGANLNLKRPFVKPRKIDL
ncbi:MAG TPA: hypothetical protein VJX73_01870 [Terracidiphilus sp.]|nr:hypothetical protein [Terracidiphilus sp.]